LLCKLFVESLNLFQFLKMKRFFTCSLLLLTTTILAQNSNPKRSVLLTLLPTEQIYADEYFVAQTVSGKRYSCILMDESKNTITFVFNGTRVKTIPVKDDIYWDKFYFDYLNSTEPNGYRFSYVKEDEKGKELIYLNCSGENYGPFENASFWLPYEYESPVDVKKVLFYYELGGRWYAKMKDRNVLLSASKNVDSSTKASPYGYSTVDGKYYVTYKNVIRYGMSYDNMWDFCADQQNYGFCYSLNGLNYVQINDKSYGPYKDLGNLLLPCSDNEITDFENFRFTYIGSDNIGYEFSKDKIKKTRFIGYQVYTSSEFMTGYGVEMYTPDGMHSFVSEYQYEYVVIDGNSYGKSPAIQAWYDSERNMFVWSAIEKKELVVYEYKL
jgi:hypothetical protein